MQNLHLLEYSAEAFFDTITHASHTNISVIPTTMSQKTTPSQLVSPGPPSIDNVAHDTEKLLLNTQVGEDFEL